jgi:hypothetical protein
LGDGQLCASAEGTGASWVEDSSVWASSISGDDVHSTRNAATWADLSQGGSGLSHDSRHAGQGVGASLGLSKSVRGSSLAVEDSGVDFSLLVGSGTWDDSSLNTETGSVSTCITGLYRLLAMDDSISVKTLDVETYHDCDLAMGRHKRGSCKSNEEELGEHICGWE